MSYEIQKIRSFNNTNIIREEIAYNGKLYFAAAPDRGTQIYEDGQTHAAIIWETDGTKEGTTALHDFAPGPTKFIPTSLKVANDHLFFEVRIDEEEGGRHELWSYKTGKGLTDHELTRLVSSIDDARNLSRMEAREPTQHGLFFLRRFKNPAKTELWFSNGEPGAENTYSLGGAGLSEPLGRFDGLTGADNLLYFISDGTESVPGRDEPRWDPNELWSTTSQPGTFRKLSDFDYSSDRGSPIYGETTIGDALYFTGPTLVETVGAYPGYNYDLEPWVSQGSNQTTQQIDDINPDRNSANLPLGTKARNFTSFKGEIYFQGYVHRSEQEPAETLYAYNPASGNVREVAQTAENFGTYRELFAFNDYLYFSGHTEETGWELWRSDGTSQGTGLLKDIKSYGSSHPQGFAIHKKDRALYSAKDDDLYFHTENGKLWKIAGDSSLIEEVEVDDLGWDGAGNITPVEIENGATDLYFTSGLALYKLVEATTVTPTPEPTPEPVPVTPTPEHTPEPTPVTPTPEPTPEPTPVTPTPEPTPEPTPVTPTPEPTASGDRPKLLKAIVRGKDITLQFDNILSDTRPSRNRFTLKQGKKEYQIVEAQVEGADGIVSLTAEKTLDPTATLTLDYLDFAGDQTKGVIESSEGVDLASFTGFPVSNQGSQNNSLAFIDGEFEGDQITLFLSDPISESIPSKSRFKVKSSNKKQKVLDVTTDPDDGIIILTTKNNLDMQESVLVSYRDLGGDQINKVIEDVAGNDMKSVKNFEVISGGNDVTKPIIESASLDEDTLTVEFDSIIRNAKISKNRFKVKIDGKRVKVLSAIAEDDDSYVEIKLNSKNLQKSDIFSDAILSYKDPKGDQTKKVVEDLFGNDLDSFKGFQIDIVDI